MLSQFDYVKPLVWTKPWMHCHARGHLHPGGGTDLLISLRHNLIDASTSLTSRPSPNWTSSISKRERTGDRRQCGVNRLIDSDLIKPGTRRFMTRCPGVFSFGTAPPGRQSATRPGLIRPLLIYDARVKIASSEGERTVDLKDFFTGVKKTQLAKNELVVSVLLPDPGQNDKSCYHRQTRLKGHDLSTVGVACRIDGQGKAAIGINAVAVTPLRLTALEMS